jgi:hypothetical protein
MFVTFVSAEINRATASGASLNDSSSTANRLFLAKPR